MRLDHVSFRFKNAREAVKSFEKLGYKVSKDYRLTLKDNTYVNTFYLKPPENKHFDPISWIQELTVSDPYGPTNYKYHSPADVIISEGSTDSEVGKWLNGSFGGLHHFAFQVDNVLKMVDTWESQWDTEFTVRRPNVAVSKPDKHTGIIYEFINREELVYPCEYLIHNLKSSKPDYSI